MTAPDLSIVIVSWNTRDLLRDALASVAASRGVRIETTVVDNASQDGSAAMVCAEFPGVRLIENAENRGFAAATNQGLVAALGRHRLLLNPDTRVTADALARLARYLDDHPGVGAVGPQLRDFDGALEPSGRAFPGFRTAAIAITPVPDVVRRWTADRHERRDYARVAEVDELTGAALCIRGAALDQVGPLDEGFFFYGEDVDLCWRLHQAGWAVTYLPEAVVYHRGGAARRTIPEAISLRIHRAYIRLLEKHRPGPSTGALRALAAGLTVFKAVRRGVPAWRRGGPAAAAASWRLHRDELAWLLGRTRTVSHGGAAGRPESPARPA